MSRSSTKAEYRSLANTTAELTWLTMLLAEFGIPQSSAPLLYCDNLSARSLATNPVFHSRSKHIEIDCHFICDKVAAKLIQLKYVPTEAQVADIFTKPLSASCFHTLSAKLMVFPSPICLRGAEENTDPKDLV